MSDSIFPIPINAFQGDYTGIVDAGDLPAVQTTQNGRTCWRFDDGADEHAMISAHLICPTQVTGTPAFAVDVYYGGGSAPSGTDHVVWDVAFEAVAESDAHDMTDSNDYFAAVQSTTDTIDADEGELNVARVSFSNAQADALAAGMLFRIVVRRDSDNGSDDYEEAVYVFGVNLINEGV